MPDPRTLVLRFSDAEGEPTIARHLEILTGGDHVWWGWWRRVDEDERVDVLEAFTKRLPEWVGLVNRREKALYRAYCTEVEFGEAGAPIPSSEPDRTPEYYRYEELPAWFRFTEIHPVTLEQWKEEFAGLGIPPGDPTLLWIQVAEAGDQVRPRTDPSLTTADTPGDAILHITDIHYGDDHGFPVQHDPDKPNRRTMVEAICDRIRALGVHVGVVVISGDLITKSDSIQYAMTVTPQLDALVDGLGLTRQHVVIVPGNHDINLKEAAEEGTRDYRHERPFRSFLDAFYGPGPPIDRLLTFHASDGWTFNFVTLNSVRLRTAATMDYGYVGTRSTPLLEGLRELHGGRTVEELVEARTLNVAVLHHHLVSGELLTVPEDDRPVSVTLDAGKLISEFQDASVHVALHGHQHVPFVGAVARGRNIGTDGWDGYRRPLWVIGGGSAGAAPTRLSDEMRDNTFGIYTPRDGGIELRMERFTPGMEPDTFLHTQLTC